jgi:hypothetical protein
MFNVATVFHGYEAMIAAAFLFTIHFFNVHLRPDKFPLDAVMFTGRGTLDYMIEEHPGMEEELRATAAKGRSATAGRARPARAAAVAAHDAGRHVLRLRHLGHRTRHDRDDPMGRALLIAAPPLLLAACARMSDAACTQAGGGVAPVRRCRRADPHGALPCTACHTGALTGSASPRCRARRARPPAATRRAGLARQHGRRRSATSTTARRRGRAVVRRLPHARRGSRAAARVVDGCALCHLSDMAGRSRTTAGSATSSRSTSR